MNLLQKYGVNPNSVYIKFVIRWNTDNIILVFLSRIGMNTGHLPEYGVIKEIQFFDKNTE